MTQNKMVKPIVLLFLVGTVYLADLLFRDVVTHHYYVFKNGNLLVESESGRFTLSPGFAIRHKSDAGDYVVTRHGRFLDELLSISALEIRTGKTSYFDMLEKGVRAGFLRNVYQNRYCTAYKNTAGIEEDKPRYYFYFKSAQLVLLSSVSGDYPAELIEENCLAVASL